MSFSIYVVFGLSIKLQVQTSVYSRDFVLLSFANIMFYSLGSFYPITCTVSLLLVFFFFFGGGHIHDIVFSI